MIAWKTFFEPNTIFHENFWSTRVRNEHSFLPKKNWFQNSNLLVSSSSKIDLPTVLNFESSGLQIKNPMFMSYRMFLGNEFFNSQSYFKKKSNEPTTSGLNIASKLNSDNQLDLEKRLGLKNQILFRSDPQLWEYFNNNSLLTESKEKIDTTLTDKPTLYCKAKSFADLTLHNLENENPAYKLKNTKILPPKGPKSARRLAIKTNSLSEKLKLLKILRKKLIKQKLSRKKGRGKTKNDNVQSIPKQDQIKPKVKTNKVDLPKENVLKRANAGFVVPEMKNKERIEKAKEYKASSIDVDEVIKKSSRSDDSRSDNAHGAVITDDVKPSCSVRPKTVQVQRAKFGSFLKRVIKNSTNTIVKEYPERKDPDDYHLNLNLPLHLLESEDGDESIESQWFL